MTFPTKITSLDLESTYHAINVAKKNWNITLAKLDKGSKVIAFNYRYLV
jgi:hypothetical protein